MVTTLDNRVENWNIEISPLNFRTEAGDQFQVGIEPQFERLPEPFEIDDGIVLLPGTYRWTRYNVQAETANKRPWVVNVEAGWGAFYDGTMRQVQVGIDLKPSIHFAFGLETERNEVSLPGGDFSTTVFALKGDYNFSPNLSWANLLQYDSESREVGVQSRLRWILKPGNDLFLVFNRGWYRDFSGDYRRTFEKAAVKLQYTFRL